MSWSPVYFKKEHDGVPIPKKELNTLDLGEGFSADLETKIMSIKTITENKFEKIIKDLIAPLFKAKGFKKKRYNFYKAFDTYGWHFNIQKSAYGSKNAISFTFNCSIFIPEIYQKKSYRTKTNS